MRVVNETFSHRCALVESLLSKAEAQVAELETLYTEKETEVWALVAIKKELERRMEELRAELLKQIENMKEEIAALWRWNES
jgi:Tfp pilus assembly protein PilO